MRRLPVFFVLDVSESMVGENLVALERGVATLLRTLRADPHALESVWVSVIAFATRARTVVPLTEIAECYAPKLPIGGGTAIGAALDHLVRDLDRTVIRTTADAKGDWKPIVFFMTDGAPTDTPAAAITRWNAHWRARTNMIAVSIGSGADQALLGQLTDTVVTFDDSSAATFEKFIQWVTMSIQVHSRSVGIGGGEDALLFPSDDVVTKVDLAKHDLPGERIDERFAVFAARCRTNRLPYLIKFERAVAAPASGASMLDKFAPSLYRLRNTYPIDESYFELSGPDEASVSVNSEQLDGHPGCPHCGAQYGLAICGCGKVHCIAGSGEAQCPWCGNTGFYGSGEAGGFDIARGRG